MQDACAEIMASSSNRLVCRARVNNVLHLCAPRFAVRQGELDPSTVQVTKRSISCKQKLAAKSHHQHNSTCKSLHIFAILQIPSIPRVHHSSPNLLISSSSLDGATNGRHCRCCGGHGRHRVSRASLGRPHAAAKIGVASVVVVLPPPARRGGEAARGPPCRGDGARGGEEERADREHQRRRARRDRVLLRQGAARRGPRRDGAHRRGRGLRQDEEAALLPLLGADERRRQDGVGRPRGRGRGRRRRVVRRRAGQQRQGPRRRQAGGGLGEGGRRGPVPIHQQRRNLQAHRRAAARRRGRCEGERGSRGRGEVPRGEELQQLGVVPTPVHDRLRQQQGLRGVVLRQDRAEAAGADPGERDAADQHLPRPGPLQHAGGRRREPRRGGGPDLQLRQRPRRHARRHGQALRRRGRRRRRRRDRALRPRRRRRRRQEGLPLPEHAFLRGAASGKGGAGVDERHQPAGGPQGALRRVRRQRTRRQGHDLRPRRQDPRGPRADDVEERHCMSNMLPTFLLAITLIYTDCNMLARCKAKGNEPKNKDNRIKIVKEHTANKKERCSPI